TRPVAVDAVVSRLADQDAQCLARRDGQGRASPRTTPSASARGRTRVAPGATRARARHLQCGDPRGDHPRVAVDLVVARDVEGFGDRRADAVDVFDLGSELVVVEDE